MKLKLRLKGKQKIVITCFLFALLTCFQSRAQQANECRSDDNMRAYYQKNPSFKKERLSLIKKLEVAQKSGNFAQKADSYVIPVVFHIFGTEFNNGTTVNDQIVKEALKFTNDEFQGLDPAWSTIDAPFSTIKQKLDITFKLAQLDPNGNPTTGIIYYDEKGGMGNYSDPTVAEVAWDNYKYCNVYITRDLYADGDFYNSGVAWYPADGMSDEDLARIVFNGSFLAGNAAIANSSRPEFRSILTHEFGHWLDLPHTFDKGVCNNDPNDGDGVADTPSHINPSSNTQCGVIYNCLNQEINNENFMDYTNCYKMFTQGQVARMVNALDNTKARNTLWTNENLIATGVNVDLGARIAFSGMIFEERFENDGIIESTIDINCIDCSFTKSSGQMVLNTDYTIANLPSGMTSRIVVNSSTSATVHIDNAATVHEAVNSVSNLSFTFRDPIINGGASSLYKDTIDKIEISFKDEYTEFCDLGIRWATYAHITEVEFNGLKNSSGYENGNSDYLDIEYPVKRGETYPLSITTNVGGAQIGGVDQNRIQVWFDWNGDFILDTDELVASHPYANTSLDAAGNYTFQTDVTIPNNAQVGKIGFRAMVHLILNDEGDDPCGTVDSGEREDYGLNILDDSVGFEVNFSGKPDVVNFSEEVGFLDLTTTENGDSVVSRKWTFEGGNPASSTSNSPKVVYKNAGTYDVTLEVTTANGQTKTVTKADYITSRLKYCDLDPSFGSYFSVNKVVLNTIDHAPQTSIGRSYYDTVGTTLEIGQSYPITITAELGNGAQSDVNRVRVWADWNFDSEFSEDELAFSKVINYEDYDSNKEITFTETITVPSYAASGKKVGLRVLGHFIKGEGGDTACGKVDSGNRADYGITISGISTSTCTDGIQNGDETGIDCGGSSCPACPVEVDGGTVSTTDDETAITTITGDGIADVISFKNTSQSTANYSYLITDEAGVILTTESSSHDFEGAAAGICRVYGISYEGSLSVNGKNINDAGLATGSFDISTNSITVTREDQTVDPTCTDGIQNGDETGIDCGGSSCPACPVEVDGGTVSTTDDETAITTITGDGIADVISFKNTSQSTANYSYLITDEAGVILATESSSHDFEGAAAGICRVYGISYEGSLSVDGKNINDAGLATGNFDISTNSITVTREDQTVDPTCTDGIQNGDETGIDCGGSCSPCDISYCSMNGTNSTEDSIAIVSFAGINNSSSGSAVGYEDYTAVVGNVTRGGSENMKVTIVGYQDGTNNEVYAWFDWNMDGDFTDADEKYSITTQTSGIIRESVISIPSTAKIGSTRMRIVVGYSATDGDSPCGTITYGEVEDYTINVSDGNNPTCTDGIQNGDETGVDCGGRDCEPCVTDGNVVYVDVDDKTVNSTNTWSPFRIEAGDEKYFGSWFSGNTIRLVTYGKDVVCEGTTNNASLIAEGVLVDASSNFVADSSSFVVSSSSYTNWNGKSGYIGFTFKISEATHYGWFYVTVANDGLSYTILDYAYNTSPNEGLVTTRNTKNTGDIGLQISASPNPFKQTTTIDVSSITDKVFTVTVYNLLGKKISEKTYNDKSEKVSVGSNIIQSGYYFAKVTTVSGLNEIVKLIRE